LSADAARIDNWGLGRDHAHKQNLKESYGVLDKTRTDESSPSSMSCWVCFRNLCRFDKTVGPTLKKWNSWRLLALSFGSIAGWFRAIGIASGRLSLFRLQRMFDGG